MILLRRNAAIFLLGTLGFMGAFGQSGPVPAAENADHVAALVKDLGSTVYAIREASQKKLLELPVQELGQLRQFAADNTDQEVSLRLHLVISTLEAIEATSAPAISVDLKNASYSEVAAALAKTAGVPIDGDALGSDDRFTLKATERPFWEVIDQLCTQHPISLAEREGLTLKPRNETSPRHRQFLRGVLFSVEEPHIDDTIMMRVARGIPARASNRISMHIGVAVDPRIALYQARVPILTRAADELGNEITSLEEEETLGKENIESPTRIWDRKMSLLGPQNMGTKITFHGSVSFAVVMGEQSVEVSEPGKHLNEKSRVGELSVVLKQIATATEGRRGGPAALRGVGVKLEVVPAARGTQPPDVGDMTTEGGFIHVPFRLAVPIQGMTEGRITTNRNDVALLDGMIRFDSPVGFNEKVPVVPLEVIVLDAEGMEILSRKVTITSATTIVLGTHGDLKPPAKVILKSGMVREVTLPFEFKDLPVRK